MATSSWSDGAVDETIGSGQDRATIAAFESAHDGETPTNGTLCKGRLVGADTGTGTQYWDGWQSGQNSSTRIVITADAANQPDGLNDASGDDALIQGYWYISESDAFYMDIISIEWSSSADKCINLSADGGGQLTIAKCVFRDQTKYVVRASGLSSSYTVNIGGCLFKAVGTDAYNSPIDNRESNCTINVINCTIVSAGGLNNYSAGIFASGSGVVINSKNCALADNNGHDIQAYNGSTINETTNKSEDDGDITFNDSDDFAEPSADDFTVYDTDSGLYHAGTQITDSWFTNLCATDFAGTSWNNPPSVGAFEYVAAGGTTVNSNIIALFDIRNQVNSNLQALFDILNTAYSSLSAPFDIFSTISSGIQSLFDIRNTVQSNLESLYDVRNIVCSNVEGLFGLLNTVNSSLAVPFDILSHVSSDLQALWDMRNIVNSNLVALYDVAGRTGSSLEAIFDIENVESVHSDMQGLFDVLNAVSSEDEFVFDILNKAHSDIESLFDLRNKAVSNMEGVFDVRTVASSNLIALYDMAGKVSSDLTLIYAVLSLGGKGRGLSRLGGNLTLH